MTTLQHIFSLDKLACFSPGFTDNVTLLQSDPTVQISETTHFISCSISVVIY